MAENSLQLQAHLKFEVKKPTRSHFSEIIEAKVDS